MRSNRWNADVLVFALAILSSCSSSSYKCAPPLPTTQPTSFYFGCPKRVVPRVASKQQASVANQANGALSVLFTTGGIDLQGPSQKLSGTWVSALDFPIDAQANPVKLTCRVRGHVFGNESSVVRAIVHMGTGGLVLSYAGASVDEKVNKEFDVIVPAGAARNLSMVIVVTGARASSTDFARLDVDSLDCQVVPAN